MDGLDMRYHTGTDVSHLDSALESDIPTCAALNAPQSLAPSPHMAKHRKYTMYVFLSRYYYTYNNKRIARFWNDTFTTRI